MSIIGHLDAQARFQTACTQGKLHHAWVLQGPSGIGKRALANHLTAQLLGQNDVTTSQIASGAHKDLCALTRDVAGKKRDIPVDDVRKLVSFFHRSAALGGWRVGIVDSLDELNPNGTNALLKTLEEPPAKCVLFLISHGRRALLPTIISRCQALRLSPLTDTETAAVLSQNGVDPSLGTRAAGRPGQALLLAEGEARAAFDASHALLERAKPSAEAKASAIRLAGKSDLAFEGFSQGLLGALATAAEKSPRHAQTWLMVSRLYADALEDSLDKTQTASRMVGALR